jgi:hypothetical protein
MDKSSALPSSVKKFNFKDGYLARCRDGMIIGKSKDKGKHITFLGNGKRLTIHTTDPSTGQRKHIFTCDNSNDIEQFEKALKCCESKNYPKTVYALPNSVFMLNFEITKNGKECRMIQPTPYAIRKLVIKMPFTEFMKSNLFLGETSHKTGIMKIPNGGCILMNKKIMKRLERLVFKIPFFGALKKGLN